MYALAVVAVYVDMTPAAHLGDCGFVDARLRIRWFPDIVAAMAILACRGALIAGCKGALVNAFSVFGGFFRHLDALDLLNVVASPAVHFRDVIEAVGNPFDVAVAVGASALGVDCLGELCAVHVQRDRSAISHCLLQFGIIMAAQTHAIVAG